MKFRNPLGVAAGMDKKAEAMRGWKHSDLDSFRLVELPSMSEFGNLNQGCLGRLNMVFQRMGFNNPGSQNGSTSL